MTVSELYDKFKLYIDKKLDTIKPQLETLFTTYKVDIVGSVKDDVVTVANNINDVVTTSTNITDVNTTAGSISSVNTVANSIDSVNIVSSNQTNVNTVAADIANVNITATNITNVNTTANNITDVTTVSTNIVNVNTVATNILNVNTTASKIIDIETFAKVYQGAFDTAPITRNDGSDLLDGDLYFDTTNKSMKVYSSVDGWKSAGSSVNGIIKRQTFTGDGSTKSFTITGGYDGGYAQVFVNGILMENGVDVDVNSGSTIDFTNAPADGDVIEFIGFGSFTLADHYTKTETNTYFAKVDLVNVDDTDILNKLKNVDGDGSGLDADLLRGLPADFTASLASSGYQKLPSGLIIQWGIDTSGTKGTVTKNFPLAFPNACLMITGSIFHDGTGSQWTLHVKTKSATQFSVLKQAGDGVDSAADFLWIAIGY